ncbi:pilus assembly protein [Methyloceanibacter sp.]|uniref:TadE/TadG family type IV pilus assembly protein n=1 Tax=Methyloceanibacter sp. TaxID=1965321 RepID=UPI002D00D5FF|nr:pilus assembly protein [Methyloceanibacter sp.]HML91302.1 pilus assembly protein [Methyloceanibacter sp.]
MPKVSRAVWYRFARDVRGNAAILFGLTIIPIILIVGVAVDYGRAVTVRSAMSDAADAAALAIGSWTNLTETELEKKAQQFYQANYASSLSSDITSDFKVNFAGDDIVVTATASVPTTFLRLANLNSLDIGTTNTITTRQRNIELALVLDTTGSMAQSGKMSALKAAAKAMVDDLFGKQSISDTLDVAVVPFAAAVNVGAGMKDASWMDKDAKSAVASEDFEGSANPFDFFKKLKGARSSWDWQGCVRERVGAEYELTDAVPTTSVSNSLFAPYLAPDEPDGDHDDDYSYNNSYIDDGDCGENRKRNRTPQVCQKYTGKYSNPSRTNSGSGPNSNCPPRPISALSNSKTTVTNAIDALEPNGSTVIPAGLLWGWRVLSPEAPFTEAEAYDEKERVKAIVLLTDGQNDIGAPRNNHNRSYYNAFGFAASGHLGSTNGYYAENELNTKTATVCSNIKAKGILIYTIGFRINDSTTQNLLKNCASKPDMYYNSPSNAQLAAVFSDIAQGLSELRIAQ